MIALNQQLIPRLQRDAFQVGTQDNFSAADSDNDHSITLAKVYLAQRTVDERRVLRKLQLNQLDLF